MSNFIIVRSDLHATIMLEAFSLSAQEFDSLFKRVTAGVGLKKPAAGREAP